MISGGQLESFEQAFSGRCSSCLRTCDCGRKFFDNVNSGYDWADGEFDKLVADPNATGLQHSVGLVCFDGGMYVDGCDCWHAKATRIANWLEGNREAVADFMNLEANRKRAEANRLSTVTVPE